MNSRARKDLHLQAHNIHCTSIRQTGGCDSHRGLRPDGVLDGVAFFAALLFEGFAPAGDFRGLEVDAAVFFAPAFFAAAFFGTGRFFPRVSALCGAVGPCAESTRVALTSRCSQACSPARPAEVFVPVMPRNSPKRPTRRSQSSPITLSPPSVTVLCSRWTSARSSPASRSIPRRERARTSSTKSSTTSAPDPPPRSISRTMSSSSSRLNFEREAPVSRIRRRFSRMRSYPSPDVMPPR